ncbi:hypothetical protein M0802_002299 [Mischocyttarus mexicanus]|nr:hypothetical protein M0802_002299 [Mischocyttarus mexicanus]
MNNIIKSVVQTWCQNRGNLFLRLTRDISNTCNVNYKSDKINQFLRHKEKFNYFINIRTYSNEFIHAESIDQKLSDNDDDKMTYGSENQYARNYLQSSYHYKNTIVPERKWEIIVTDEEAKQLLNKDWSTATVTEIVLALRTLSYHIVNKSDHDIDQLPRYDHILNALTANIDNLTLDLLEKVLISLLSFPEHLKKTKEFNNLWKSLDNYCQKQYTNWPIDKMFLIADSFLCLHYKNSDYIWKFLRKMNSKLNKLTAKNVVQLMFIVNIIRQTPLNMYEVECILEQHLDDLTINELGLIAMGFFKSNTKIRDSKLLKAITLRLANDLKSVDNVSLSALFKLIRFSMQFNELEHLEFLLNKMLPLLPELGLLCLTHILHTYAKTHLYLKPFMDTIMNRFYNEMENTRLKDIERLAYTLNVFSIDTKNPIYDKIIEELTRRTSDDQEEINKFPWIFINILQHLAYAGIYPLNLIKLAFDPSHINLWFKGNNNLINFQYSILEYCVKIERPEYTGPFLSENMLITSTKRHWREMNQESASMTVKILNEIVLIMKETIANNVDLYIGRILPQFKKDNVVIGMDEDQNFISAEPILSQLSDISIKRVDDTFPKNIKWLLFTVIHHKHLMRKTNKPTGIVNAKLRQLKQVGYTPILVTSHEWFRYKTTEAKTNYLKSLITSTI